MTPPREQVAPPVAPGDRREEEVALLREAGPNEVYGRPLPGALLGGIGSDLPDFTGPVPCGPIFQLYTPVRFYLELFFNKKTTIPPWVNTSSSSGSRGECTILSSNAWQPASSRFPGPDLPPSTF